MVDEQPRTHVPVRSVLRPDLVLPDVGVLPAVAPRLPRPAALRLPLADTVVRATRLPLLDGRPQVTSC
jgi:hypothetical protein